VQVVHTHVLSQLFVIGAESMPRRDFECLGLKVDLGRQLRE